MKAYRIVEVRNGRPCTLFHGWHGSRQLPTNRWLEAEVKVVRDGGQGPSYKSGFHVCRTREVAERLLKRFRRQRHLVIVEVKARGLRPKRTNSQVALATKMLIPDIDV